MCVCVFRGVYFYISLCLCTLPVNHIDWCSVFQLLPLCSQLEHRHICRYHSGTVCVHVTVCIDTFHLWVRCVLSVFDDDDCIERPNTRFCTMSSLRRELSPTRTLKWPGRNHVQITCSTSSAYRNDNNSNNHIDRRSLRFFTVSSLCRELSPTRTLKWSGCNCVQIT